MKISFNKLSWSRRVWDRLLSVILALIILSALGMLAYTVAVPKPTEKFSEFYLLGLSGRAEGYPTRLVLGEEGKVVVGIINREGMVTTYRVEVRIDGVIRSEVGPVTLKHDEKWEEIVGFTPDRAGDKQKVEFLLYKSGQGEAYLNLHLWVNVE